MGFLRGNWSRICLVGFNNVLGSSAVFKQMIVYTFELYF